MFKYEELPFMAAPFLYQDVHVTGFNLLKFQKLLKIMYFCIQMTSK